MKRELIFTCGSVLFVVGAACAGAEDDPQAAPGDDPDAVLGDAASPGETNIEDGAVVEGPTCSPAGWCPTTLPDPDLTLKDVWPLPGRAFAVAESPTRGVKVLAWTDAEAKWSYIDDNSQNASGRGQYAGKIWAPTEDEVYFTAAPHTVYHGRRQNTPTPGWTWTHQELDDLVPEYPASTGDHYRGRPTFGPTKTTYVSLGVFGTGADDVYAWYANAIYHATKDQAGNLTWTVEYVADDLDSASEQLFFIGATATGKDDVWFAGGRAGAPDTGGCPILVHKTAAGYRRAADGTRTTGSPPTDGGIVFPPTDGGIVFPPTDGGIVLPPTDGGIVLPPTDGGIVLPPTDGGIVLPPTDGGIVFPPTDGGIVFPPTDGGGITQTDGGFVFPDGGLHFPDGGIPIVDGGVTIGDGGLTPTTPAFSCKARVGTILLGTSAGWLASVDAVAPQQVVSLKGGREVVRVSKNGNDYTSAVATLPSQPSTKNFISAWTSPTDQLWLGGQNIILRGSNDPTDGGTYEISTISLTGAWLDTPIYQVRGSSNLDRWAVGARHALHKTTP